MALKTEEYSYNEDNFIEENGTFKELTVTITLEEYRNLIREQCYNEKAIETLQEENEALRKEISKYKEQNNTLMISVCQRNPEIIDKIIETVDLLKSNFCFDVEDLKKDGGNDA